MTVDTGDKNKIQLEKLLSSRLLTSLHSKYRVYVGNSHLIAFNFPTFNNREKCDNYYLKYVEYVHFLTFKHKIYLC